MKTGISSASLSDFETEDALKIINGLNAEAVEVHLKTFYEYRPEFAKKYSDLVKGGEVFLHCEAFNFEKQLFSPSRRVRGDGFYWLDQILRSAQLFGAKKYVFAGVNPELPFDELAGRVCEISDFCNGYGINLCLENTCAGIVNNPYIFSQLKARCPQISAGLNIGEAVRSNYPYTMYLNDMSGAISHIYLENNEKPTISKLKEKGFDGTVILKRRMDEGELKEIFKSIS